MKLAAWCALVLAPSLVIGTFACTGTDFVSSSTPDADDAGAADAGGNVLKRGDFETTGCIGWESNEATLTADPERHGGMTSCRVCATGDSAVWGIFQNVTSVTPGAYIARGFARTSGDAGPFSVVLRLQAVGDAGEDLGEARDGTATFTPDEDWSEATTELAIEPGQHVAVGVLSTLAGGCFLIDDLTLVKK